MNVLSLFDGMSCGQQALDRLGVKVDNYFASEIDKYAIQVTMANYPDTIQLGSVVNVDGKSLPKIELLLGGSPCTNFSFAGKRKGMSTKDEQEILTLEHYLQLKSEGFEFEGQSYLFWEYMRILTELREINPNIKFLLENVEMGEKWEKILSRAIGVNGIHINSALVSAQNRKRIYWCNFGMRPMGLFGDLESIIQQPKDRGILLKDILENDVDEKYFLSEKMIAGFERHKERHNNKGTGFGYVPKNEDDKGNSLRANAALAPTDNMLIVHNTQPRSADRPSLRKNKHAGGSGHLTRNDGKTYCLDGANTNAVEIVAMRGRTENKGEDWHNSNHVQKLEIRNDGKTNSLTSVAKDNMVRKVKQISDNNKSNGGTQPYQHDRIYDVNGISPALNTDGRSHAVEIVLTSKDKRLKQTIDENDLTKGEVKALDTYNQSTHDRYPTLKDPRHNDRALFDGSRIRRLTPIECERLQTVKDNYTNCVSDSQRYKMLGNGWTIDVIAHLLSYLKSI
jgi:DNA (cytosine-5)-methyltransferase 3A